MSYLIASNTTLRDSALLERDRLNSSGVLQLFIDDYQPDSTSTRDNFIRASYTGYVPYMLTGAFLAPLKIKDGVYVIRTGSIPWHVTTANGQKVYGWFIQVGDDIRWSQRLPNPIVLTNGQNFSFVITIQLGSIDVICG